MTLLAPLFLLGALAVGLPLWLHRLSSENPNKQPFSSAMFLEPGEPRRVLAKKLQYLLLLALRIGVLVLLALTFARPALQGAAQALIEGDARLHVIVVDVSTSMMHGDRAARAREAALDVVDDVPSGDLLQLVAMGRGAQPLTEPTADFASVRQRINALEPEYARVDYGELMSSVDRMLRGIEMPVTAYIVSDMQRTSMPTRFAELAAQTPLDLEIRDVSRPGEDNSAVQSASWQALSGEVSAGVRNYSAQPSNRTLVLELNGERQAAQPLTVPAGATATASFADVELASGANRVRVALEPADELAADDQRFLVVKRPEPRTILLIAAAARGRDSVFLTAALEAVNGPMTSVESISPAAIVDRDLGSYAFVVVADAGVLDDDYAAILQAYVEAGGAVLLALGPRSAGLANVPVTGQAFGTTADLSFGGRDEFTIVGYIDASHPALAGTEELRAAKFFRYLSVEPNPGDQVLAALEDGTPILIERTQGDGRAIVFASSLDREWNDLPVNPVFVPLIAGLSSHLSGDLAIQTEAALGSTLSPRAVGLAGGQIFDPDGNAALGIAAAGAGDEVLVERVGFYEVLGAGTTELVAVNLDPNESDLAPVEPNAIERWRGLNAAMAPGGGGATVDLAPTEPTPLWPWVLGLLIAVVFVESWVGNWHLRVRRGLAA